MPLLGFDPGSPRPPSKSDDLNPLALGHRVSIYSVLWIWVECTPCDRFFTHLEPQTLQICSRLFLRGDRSPFDSENNF